MAFVSAIDGVGIHSPLDECYLILFAHGKVAEEGVENGTYVWNIQIISKRRIGINKFEACITLIPENVTFVKLSGLRRTTIGS